MCYFYYYFYFYLRKSLKLKVVTKNNILVAREFFLTQTRSNFNTYSHKRRETGSTSHNMLQKL